MWESGRGSTERHHEDLVAEPTAEPAEAVQPQAAHRCLHGGRRGSAGPPAGGIGPTRAAASEASVLRDDGFDDGVHRAQHLCSHTTVLSP